MTQDYSKLGNSPGMFTTTKGETIKYYPISIMALAVDMGRNIKAEQQNALIKLIRANRELDSDVMSKCLAEIERQIFTIGELIRRLKTLDGMRYAIWKSILPDKPALKLENVPLIVDPDDWIALVNLILESSGIETGGQEPENPTKLTD